MLFLVQSNIYTDPDHDRIFDALNALGLDYETIELDKDTQTISVQSGRTDVFVYGSVKLARLAAQRKDWHPGSFYGGNHRFEVHVAHYGENMLNYGARVFPFGMPVEWEPGASWFIKPYQDAKLFTGSVFTAIKWADFVARSLESPATPMLTAESLVQASIPQHIIKEARLWIVGRKIVEAVYYKFDADAEFEPAVNPDGLAFANRMIAVFDVADAYVMDICETPAGWKIVEINCINSAGFYPTVNVTAIVRALDAFFSK